jgi:enediyne biosynthesis protein E4
VIKLLPLCGGIRIKQGIGVKLYKKAGILCLPFCILEGISKSLLMKYIVFACFWAGIVAGCKQNNSLFTLLDARQTGIHFINHIDEDAENNVLNYGYFYNGGGVAAADFNNDGLVDLYFSGNMVANKLYLNKGDLQFEDISEKAGVALHEGWKTGVSLVDINNDGWIDIYVCRSGAENPKLRRNLLYVNNGQTADGVPRFTEQAAAYGLDDDAYTTQAVFFDYDKDGLIDCFLLNHSVQDYAGFSTLLSRYREQKQEKYGNKLLRNNGNGFTNVTDSAGIISNVLSFGLGINVCDFNNDGWPDIYVANDYNEHDYLYLNQQDGTFKDVIRDATGHVSMYSMGTDAADLNNNGWMDIMTLDMLPSGNERIKLTAGDDNYDKYQQLLRAGFHHQTMRNMLHVNNGTNAEGVPVFSEIGQMAGVSNTDWSWSTLMADFDNDGWKDIFVTNGYKRDYTNMQFLKYSTELQLQARQTGKPASQLDIINQMPAIHEPNYIFQNQGNLTFTQKMKEWGLEERSESNGAIYADLDNDGDLDLVVNNINQKAFVYRNNAEARPGNSYLKVQLAAPDYALLPGTRVQVFSRDNTVQTQEFMPVRGYQSAQWDALHFGFARNDRPDSVRVSWPDGRVQLLKEIALNQTLAVHHKNAGQYQPSITERMPPLWQEASLFDFQHQEVPRNDFYLQPLLPAMLSYQGPRMAQADLNGDGLPDVYVGGARGQAGGLFLSQGKGLWQKQEQAAFTEDAAFEDATIRFFDANNDGHLDLLVSSSGYDLKPQDPLLQPRLYLNEAGKWRRAPFPELFLNAAALAIADLDQDGDLDIFIAERVKPGKFPLSAGGKILLNDGKGNFSDQTSSLAPQLPEAGMITDAQWADLNGDGYPELLLTGDWMALRVFANSKGRLSDESTAWGTAGLTGCWNVIRAADLDGDGDLDFIVGNMGKNWQWNVTSSQALQLYAADFDNTGGLVPVVSVSENGKEYAYASRDEMLDQVPSLKKKFLSYTSYSTATLSDILPAEKLAKAHKGSAAEWRTGVLENKNGAFVFHPLPPEAQYAPVYAIALTDTDKDGRLDIVLGGNAEHTRIRMGKNDANLLQVFQNRGNMQFAYVPQQQAGLFVKGDVRDLLSLETGEEKWMVVAINNKRIQSYRLNQVKP